MMRDDLVRCLTAPNPSPLTGAGTNTYLIGSRDIAVIDPGPDIDAHLDAILALVRAGVPAGGRISHIVVTHAHRDHSALAPRLAARTNAPVLAFGDALAGRSPRMTALAGALPVSAEGLDLAFHPDRTLRDGETIRTPDWELVAHHTPGHLGGHLCLALGRVLFSGDHVMGWSTSIVAPPDGDMADYMASLHRLAGATWDRFLPGHGAPVENPAARLSELIRHRMAREAAILAALALGPARIPDLAARVYTDIPPTLLLAAERNVFAHLLDLEARNLVSATPAPHPDATYTRA
ncbi:MAG: MBL fold metallo-hydrolase [Rhodobacterales bacterium 32-66-7]|nr:MAG: MBL fold metallo-hydrolase [Rhodobacterales bacterium 32-66-7]